MLGGGTSIRSVCPKRGIRKADLIALTPQDGRFPREVNAENEIRGAYFLTPSKLLILKSFGSGFWLKSTL